MLRFYILPVEAGTEFILFPAGRGPKYIAWPGDPDPPGIECDFAMIDYGALIDAGLVVANVTTAQHNALVANSNVVSPPQDIDQNIASNAIPTVQNVLEALRIPADWVDTSYTYRQILRMISGLFQFAQRYYGMHGEALIDNVGQLDIAWNTIPTARQDKVRAAADWFGYDYSDFQGAWLVRRILFRLAQQWGSRPIQIGPVVL